MTVRNWNVSVCDERSGRRARLGDRSDREHSAGAPEGTFSTIVERPSNSGAAANTRKWFTRSGLFPWRETKGAPRLHSYNLNRGQSVSIGARGARAIQIAWWFSYVMQ